MAVLGNADRLDSSRMPVDRREARTRHELLCEICAVIFGLAPAWTDDSSSAKLVVTRLTRADVRSAFDEIGEKFHVGGIDLRFAEQEDGHLQAIFQPAHELPSPRAHDQAGFNGWEGPMILRLVNPDQHGVFLTRRGLRESQSIRRANIEMRRRSVGLDRSEPFPFLCECRAAGCDTLVFISTAAFDALLTAERGWVLAAGHEPSAPGSLPEVLHPASVRVSAPLGLDRNEEGVGGGEAA